MLKPLRMSKPWHQYGLSGLLSLSWDMMLTRLSFPPAKIVRRPCYISGKQWITVGKGFIAGPGLRIEALGSPKISTPIIRIGKNVVVNDYVHIGGIKSVLIGDRVLIASKVFISDHSHGSYGGNGIHCDPRIPPNDRPLQASPVVIEEDVWIGESVSILQGVKLGRGCVVGANSVVTHSVPPYAIAIGAPARVIKEFDFERHQWRESASSARKEANVGQSSAISEEYSASFQGEANNEDSVP
jgi:acetyltransferase-like isoleucine patch superfamily enzyme